MKLRKWLQKMLGINIIIEELKKSNENLEKLSSCVDMSSRKYGKRRSLTTGHWND